MEPGGIGNQSALYPQIIYTMQDEFSKVEEENRRTANSKDNETPGQPQRPASPIAPNPSRQQYVAPVPKAKIRRSGR